MKRNIYKIIIPILLAIAFMMTACSERKETFESPNGTNKVTISYDFASRPSVIYNGETIWKYEGSGFNEEVFFKVDWTSENAFNLRYDDETHNGKYSEIFYIELWKADTAENEDDAGECLAYAKEIAEQEKCYKMMLLTGSKKPETLHFYEKAGYNSSDKTAFIQWLGKDK